MGDQQISNTSLNPYSPDPIKGGGGSALPDSTSGLNNSARIHTIFHSIYYLSVEALHYRKSCYNTMDEHLKAIDSSMNFALSNGWITEAEKQDIIQRLSTVKNAKDAFLLEQVVVNVLAIDPELKIPPPVSIPEDSFQDIEDRMSSLAAAIGLPIHKTSTGDSYIIDDNGSSILYLSVKKGVLLTAQSRQILRTYILMATGSETPAAECFLRLYGLGINEESLIQIEQLQKKLQDERSICEALEHLPQVPVLEAPMMENARCQFVIQGSGMTVSSDNVDFIGTRGVGPCVAVIMIQAGKAFLSHIDSFAIPLASLSQKEGRRILDEHISGFWKDESLSIYLVGANQGGRETVIQIYEYLREHGLHENIRAATVLQNEKSYSVVVDVKEGTVFALPE